MAGAPPPALPPAPAPTSPFAAVSALTKAFESTASRADGIDAATEFDMRVFGCELIQEAGILLKLYAPLADSLSVIFASLAALLAAVLRYFCLMLVLMG
jgi:hypothetical protein